MVTPTPVELVTRLRAAGYAIDGIPLTIEEGLDMLIALLDARSPE
jgi:hypothetical protein